MKGRVSTKVAHPINLVNLHGQLRDYTPPHDWTGACRKIADAGKIELSVKAAEFLWQVLWEYEREALFEKSRPLPGVHKREIDKISTAASILEGLLAKAVVAEPNTTWSLLTTFANDPLAFGELPASLKQLSTVCRTVSDDLATRVPKRMGRPGAPGFAKLIRRLSTIYYLSGGTPSASYSDGENAGRHGPFVRFCEAIIALVELPEGAKPPKNIGEAIADEARRGKKDEWQGYSDDSGLQQIASVLGDEHSLRAGEKS